jgi:hypothetical protein
MVSALAMPPGYICKDIVEETLDSVSVIAMKQAEGKSRSYSIRIFSPDRPAVKEVLKWNASLQMLESSGTLDKRFLTYDPDLLAKSRGVYGVRPYHPRTLEFVCFFGVDLFDDEKHAICFQLGEMSKKLRGFGERLPIFPSRILLHDDLFVQLTDFYPPNPIDEEACELGWFEKRMHADFFRTIVAMLWRVSREEAGVRLLQYESLGEGAPEWGAAFLQKHRRTSQTDGLPPLIVLDINRANVAQFSPEIMNHALCEILRIIPELDGRMVELRVVPMLSALMPIEHDVIQSIVLLLLVAVLRKIGFTAFDRVRFTGYVERILLRSSNTASRFTLYGVLRDVVQFIAPEERETLIRAMICSRIGDDETNSVKEHELVVFTNGVSSLMAELNRLSLLERQTTIKPFACRVIATLPLTNSLFTSLIAMDTSLYVVDTVLARMPQQIKSQPEMRFLVHVAEHATREMLFRFNFVFAASSHLTVSSLAIFFLQKLRRLIHPVVFRMLVPSEVQQDLVVVPDSPHPTDDTLLESIAPMIARFVVGERPPMAAIREPQTKQISLELGNVRDFDFSADGKTFVVAGSSSVRFWPVNALTSPPTECRLDFDGEIDRIGGFGDSIFVAGHSGNTLKLCSWQLGQSERVQERVSIEGAGPVTAFEKSDRGDLILLGTDSGMVYMKRASLEVQPFFQVSRTLGCPISFAFLPSSSYYVVGTSEGTVIVYDFRMQCPLRRTRPSNRPAFVSASDPRTFWITCGPYATQFRIAMDSISRTFQASGTHAVLACGVRDWLITAHSDFSMFAFNGQLVVDLNNPNAVKQVRQSDRDIAVVPSLAVPRHSAPIRLLKSSPVAFAPISCDAAGRLVIWPTPFLTR